MPSRNRAQVVRRPEAKSLPTPRTRSLTLSLEADHQRSVAGEACPSTCNQLQSLLFKDFPLELRERIYKDVLGGFVCHVWPHGTSVCRENGKWAPDSGLSCFCGPPILENLQNISELRHLGARSTTTSFLRSCRRVYSEAIDFLYRDNTFEVLDAAGFTAFSVSVLPHRFDKICSMRVGQQITATFLDSCMLNKLSSHRISHCYASAWEECWDLIANMKSLRELFVTLCSDRGRPFSKAEEEKLLAPLNRVSKPQTWQLFVNWPSIGIVYEPTTFEKHYLRDRVPY